MQTGRLGWAFVVSALIASCLGCHVTSERFIVGTYRAEASCAVITLVVNRDHSFAQSVRTNTGEVNQVTGTWALDEKGWITLRPFLDFLRDDHGRQLEGAFFRPELLPRGVTLGPIVMKCPDSDHQIDYVK
jgi:hypothetical protein